MFGIAQTNHAHLVIIKRAYLRRTLTAWLKFRPPCQAHWVTSSLPWSRACLAWGNRVVIGPACFSVRISAKRSRSTVLRIRSQIWAHAKSKTGCLAHLT